MSKELTRWQVEGALQYIGKHVEHLSSPDSYVLKVLGTTDAAQREKIQQLEARVKELQRINFDYELGKHACDEHVAKLEARLEIDHAYDQDGKRFEIPPSERHKQIDGIACRDATISGLDRKVNELEARVRVYEDRLFRSRAMDTPPCFCCGYNGPGYYQPGTHPCAARHHVALDSSPDSA